MPPINLYTNSAINAAKASAAAPQTSKSEQESAARPLGESTPSTPTTTSHAAPAIPVPALTGTGQRYAPSTVQPTPTTTFDAVPPAPQPGAFPVPVNMNSSPTPKGSIPPPPKAGEKFIQPARTETFPTPQQHYPSQMYMPPLTTPYGAQPPASSTLTTTTPSALYPAPLPTEGPPGYRQNPYASDLNPDQRRAQDAGNSDPSMGGFADDGASGNTSLAEDAQNAWNAVSSWASKAGEKISEAESEVWKRVNK